MWTLLTQQLVQQWYSLDKVSRSKYSRRSSRCPEPSLGLFRPDVCFGSVSENFQDITEKFLQNRGMTSQGTVDTHRYQMSEFKYNMSVSWEKFRINHHWNYLIWLLASSGSLSRITSAPTDVINIHVSWRARRALRVFSVILPRLMAHLAISKFPINDL